MLLSRIDDQARLKPSSSDTTRFLPTRSSSFIRSKIRMLASTAMPTDSTNAPTPASVSVTGKNLKMARTMLV